MQLNAQRIMAVWFLMFCPACYSSDIVFLDGSRDTSASDQQIRIATSFNGLSTARYSLEKGNDPLGYLQALRQKSTLAVIVSASALPALDQRQVFAALRREHAPRIPLLVVGVTEETAPAALRKWSGNAISGCQGPWTATRQNHFKIATLKDFTKELSGQDLPVWPGRTCSFLLDRSKAQSVVTLSSGSAEEPVFVRTEFANQEVFFAAGFESDGSAPPGDAYDQPLYQFTRVAPVVMFLRYGAGERGWHTGGHYANLTIDDALLREPYGHVKYWNLLREMQSHNFHTTIAFIPWNFDRWEPKVVSLFRTHSDRFSVCVHGDNHDHQEFPSFRDKALALQTANIRQALARMEEFHKLTGIPYDRVMVFPHSIAPAETLGALKRSNYVATANSQNIPLGSQAPADPTFALQPVTLAYANFPSLRRYSAEVAIPPSELAVDAFLGNPLLFYVHQEYFAGGPARFDSIADEVNRIEPATEWRGLGYIAERLYVERSRDDGNYDVKAFSSTLQLENGHRVDAVFYVEKDEDFGTPLKLIVDGQEYPYARERDHMRFKVPVGAGMSRHVTIRYQEDMDLSTVDTSRSSLRVAILRYLSEFRDNVVSRSRMGRKFIRTYTGHEAVVNRGIGVLLVCLVLTVLAFVLRGVQSNRRSKWGSVVGEWRARE
jgi:hypothetical protein